MTAFANITLNDGQATPVAHTFSARRIENQVAKWQDISIGQAVGFPTLRASLREPIKGSKIPCYKAVIDISVPTLEVVNASTYNGITPAPTKAYDHLATVSFIMPERGTLQERKNVLAYLANALAQIDLKSMVTDLNMVY